jgi:large subunit ribosomal protein L21e
LPCCCCLCPYHHITSTEKPPSTKRLPKGPRPGFTLENVKMETITAIPYDIVKEGLQ